MYYLIKETRLEIDGKFQEIKESLVDNAILKRNLPIVGDYFNIEWKISEDSIIFPDNVNLFVRFKIIKD